MVNQCRCMQKQREGNKERFRVSYWNAAYVGRWRPLTRGSVTSILDPTKREIRVKKRLYMREKKKILREKPFQKARNTKKMEKTCFIAFLLTNFSKISCFSNIFLPKKFKELKVAKTSVRLKFRKQKEGR